MDKKVVWCTKATNMHGYGEGLDNKDLLYADLAFLLETVSNT